MSVQYLPLKRLVDPGRPITYGIVQAGPDTPGGVPYIRPIDMRGHLGVDTASLQRTTPEVAAAYSRSSLVTGDIVISIGPSYGKTMVVGPELEGANLTQGTARVAPARNVDISYLIYTLQSSEAISFWDSSVGGATFRALNLGPLSNTPVPIHPYPDQRRIADYLDRETAEIDQLVSDYQALTVLLTERLSATVTTLTRPEDARPAALRHLANIKLGKMLRESDLNETARLYLRAANIQEWGRLTHLSDSKMMNTSPAERSALTLEKNDVVLVEGGAGYGKSAVLEDDLNDWIFQNHVFRIRARESVAWGPYLHFALLAEKLNGGFDVRVTQATIPTLSTANLASVEIMAPSKQRQIELSTQIAVKVESALQTLQDLSKAVLLAQERRAALISAAVTGQIDVTVQGASAAEQLRDELEVHA
ncbi:hypothetical protein HCH15_11955 [Corynebacterium testudinoris]|uniref:restriction endonuclease subunit S n=1 Tax=Corynebacterium testudinoris TaxID=136857 RepID=UPI001C8BFA6A|nr:restriction endonuclease subunit S [Corynebacterium testudinoris]MBX8996885.1 hypothetical protein [Corynebacterium testudinoris]